MNQQELLMKIAEIEFIGVELNLFLDTHPDNMQAMVDYNAYAAQLHELRKEYVMKYAPLLGFASNPISAPDSWINSTWPWEHHMKMEG